MTDRPCVYCSHPMAQHLSQTGKIHRGREADETRVVCVVQARGKIKTLRIDPVSIQVEDDGSLS